MPYRDGEPFIPVGPTSLVAMNTPAINGVTLAGDTVNDPLAFRQYRIYNAGNQTAFYSFASTNTGAASAAVIPTNASVGGNSYPLPPGAIEVITTKTGQYWSGITATNTAVNVYITPGKGV